MQKKGITVFFPIFFKDTYIFQTKCGKKMNNFRELSLLGDKIAVFCYISFIFYVIEQNQ